MKQKKKEERARKRKLKQEKQMSIFNETKESPQDSHLPDISYYTTQYRIKDSMADSPTKSLYEDSSTGCHNKSTVRRRMKKLDLDLINNCSGIKLYKERQECMRIDLTNHNTLKFNTTSKDFRLIYANLEVMGDVNDISETAATTKLRDL